MLILCLLKILDVHFILRLRLNKVETRTKKCVKDVGASVRVSDDHIMGPSIHVTDVSDFVLGCW